MIRYLKEMKSEDPQRFAVVEPFAQKFEARAVLSSTHDCVCFLNALGVKAVKGKTRSLLGKEIFERLKLVSFDDLLDKLEEAGEISEAKRSQGYGILTDHLMRTDK